MMTAQHKRPLADKRAPANAQHARVVPVRSFAPATVVQRAPSCACGGSCPRCRAQSRGLRVIEAGESDDVHARTELGSGPDSLGVSRIPVTAKPIQRKPAVSSPGDPFELEADEVAGKVMRMAEPGTAGSVPAAIQRKCAACEDGTTTAIQTKHASSANGEADLDTASAVHAAEHGGVPLPGALRSFFEPRFGHDFGDVRVHADGTAAEGARAVQARAYTIGRDIVFGAGQFAPGTYDGRHLLAHELAHVAQAGDATTIRRLDFDYEIRDLPADARHITNRIFFERGQAIIPGPEAFKIPALASPAGQNLTLHGFSSEDATAVADRAVRVSDRLDAVQTALRAAGHTGLYARVEHPNEGLGDRDYRHRRSVQVLPTAPGGVPTPTTVNQCGVAGAEIASGAALTACEAAFTAEFPEALATANDAERDVVTTPTPAADALVTRFFSGVPRADVNANVTAIAAQVRQLDTRHQCHTDCDGGCDRPAYNGGTGLGPSGAMMTLCPGFVSSGSPFRVKTLVHEAAHGNPVESIKDIAYASTRLVPFLLPADARRNTDSYVLLMRLVRSPGSMRVGPATPDTLVGMTGAGPGSDTDQANRAVAWLESWLNYGDFDTGLLYSTIVRSLDAGAWVATAEFNIQTMNRLATAFAPDLTDPGADGLPRTTPPAPLPTVTDKLRVAAIHDRFDQMYDAVHFKVLTVTRAPAGGAESWGRQTALPRLDRNITVAPSFFSLSAVDQVKRLVALMARARTDISGAYEAKYVDAIDRIRTHRRLGP